MNMIKWQEIFNGLNEMNEKRGRKIYRTEKEMLSDLYETTRSSHRMEDILGVTPPVIRCRMRKLGIEIQNRGGHRNIFSKVRWGKDRLILDIVKEAQEKFGMGCRSGAYAYARLHDKPYKKLTPQGKPIEEN